MPVIRSSLRKNINKVLENDGIVLKPQLEYETEELIIESVKRNAGIGYVVKGNSIDIESQNIDVIEFNKKLPTVEINLVYVESYLPALARNFINEEIIKL